MTSIDRSSLNALLDLIGGDIESLNELIDSFVDEFPVFSQDLSKGLTDIELLSRTAHTLKSSARDFGATTLSELCTTLERQAKSNSFVDEADQVLQIQQELERCLLELNQIRSEQIPAE